MDVLLLTVAGWFLLSVVVAFLVGTIANRRDHDVDRTPARGGSTMIDVVVQLTPDGIAGVDRDQTRIDGAPPTADQWGALQVLGPLLYLWMNGESDDEIERMLGDNALPVAASLSALGVLDVADSGINVRSVNVAEITSPGVMRDLYE